MGALVDCCTGEDTERPTNIDTETNNDNSHSSSQSSNKNLELSPIIIIGYIISLNNNQLKEGWEYIDSSNKNKMNLDHEFKQLIRHYCDDYIKTQIPSYDKDSNHKYSKKK
eukprot:838908_1